MDTKTISLNENQISRMILKQVKRRLNEMDNYNYPMGSDTSYAPWNEDDSDIQEHEEEAGVINGVISNVFTYFVSKRHSDVYNEIDVMCKRIYDSGITNNQKLILSFTEHKSNIGRDEDGGLDYDSEYTDFSFSFENKFYKDVKAITGSDDLFSKIVNEFVELLSEVFEEMVQEIDETDILTKQDFNEEFMSSFIICL